MKAILLSAALLLALAGCATAPASSQSVAGDYLSGRVAAGVNDIAGAADKFAAAVNDDISDQDALRKAFFYNLAAGRVDTALPLAERLTANDKSDGLARLALACGRIKRGDLDGAFMLLDGDFNESFSKSIAFLTRVWLVAEQQGPGAGLDALGAAPADIFKGFNPGVAALLAEAAGDPDAARAAHQLAVGSFAGPVGREAYGAFLERAGDDDAARSFYETLERERGGARRTARAGLERLQKKSPSESYTDLSAAEGAAIALYNFSGNTLEQSAGERARASEAGFNVGQPQFTLPLALVQLALYLDPDLAPARQLAGSILNAYGNHEAARDIFSKIRPQSAYYEQAQIEIAASLAAEDRSDEAIALLRSAVRADRKSEEMRLTLAGFYAEQRRFLESVNVVSEAIALLSASPPEDAWRLYVGRAAALIELKRWSEAQADLKRAVEIAPEEPTTLNYLGYSWAERGENLEEAFKLIERAVALAPNSGAIIDSLGWAHYQLGRYEEALPHLEKAASLEPADPTITDHLGDAYARLGRMIEAEFQWRRALELKPSDAMRAALEKKLVDGLPPATKSSS
ncbi:MAG: tetratricopeptide repeat protein [Parvularculaceae bacterium]|nr:tetratricopeptide repeat protein [Parvularculaceae bacterium]